MSRVCRRPVVKNKPTKADGAQLGGLLPFYKFSQHRSWSEALLVAMGRRTHANTPRARPKFAILTESTTPRRAYTARFPPRPSGLVSKIYTGLVEDMFPPPFL